MMQTRMQICMNEAGEDVDAALKDVVQHQSPCGFQGL